MPTGTDRVTQRKTGADMNIVVTYSFQFWPVINL